MISSQLCIDVLSTDAPLEEAECDGVNDYRLPQLSSCSSSFIQSINPTGKHNTADVHGTTVRLKQVIYNSLSKPASVAM